MSHSVKTGLYTGYIYCIENTANGKKYIGQTIVSIESRFSQHISDANHGSDTYLHRAMRLFGHEKFVVREICREHHETKEGLKAILNDLEIFYISEFRSLHPNGYNLTTGGDAFAVSSSRPICKVDPDGNVLGVYGSIREAANDSCVDEKTIGHGCRSKTHYGAGLFWYYMSDGVKVGDNIGKQSRGSNNWPGHTTYVGKQIGMFSMDGILLRCFRSASDASRELNINRGNISTCCRGAAKSAGGYRWAYLCN